MPSPSTGSPQMESLGELRGRNITLPGLRMDAVVAVPHSHHRTESVPRNWQHPHWDEVAPWRRSEPLATRAKTPRRIDPRCRSSFRITLTAASHFAGTTDHRTYGAPSWTQSAVAFEVVMTLENATSVN